MIFQHSKVNRISHSCGVLGRSKVALLVDRSNVKVSSYWLLHAHIFTHHLVLKKTKDIIIVNITDTILNVTNTIRINK